jgi:hypothetical protein
MNRVKTIALDKESHIRNDAPPRAVANSDKENIQDIPREDLESSNPAMTPTTNTENTDPAPTPDPNIPARTLDQTSP